VLEVKMNSVELMDISGVLLFVLMAYGSWYVLKLIRLSESWKSVWLYFLMFILFQPGSRAVIEIWYATCPSEVGVEMTLKIICPILGALFFVVFAKKLYHLFYPYMKRYTGKNRINAQEERDGIQDDRSVK
jgi:hypothetical protein